MKLFKCKYCREKVEANELSSRLPQVCKKIDCISKKYDEFKEKIHAKARVNLKVKSAKEKKVEKEKLKTHKDYLKDFEKVFNEYIRKRDKGQPCISCQKPYGEFTESAGHYFPAGSNGSIRFDEDNVHLQCWFFCNKNRHGNQVEYLPNLIKKIGQQRFDELSERRNEPLKLSMPEIKEKIKHYKLKIKEL